MLYTTRSLTAWTLIVMLSQLGFEVRPSPVLINTEELYKEKITLGANSSPPSEVFLIAYNGPETDLSTPPVSPGQHGGIRKHVSYTPRVVPIKAIPRVIFRDIRQNNESELLDVEKLCKVWNDTFDHAYNTIDHVQLDNTTAVWTAPNDNILLENRPTGDEIVPRVMATQEIKDSHGGDFPPLPQASHPYEYAALFQVIAPELKRYLPGYDWT